MYNVFIASNCTCMHLIMICYVIIFGSSSILNIFVFTYHDILYHKCLLCIYVLREDGPRSPNHLGEIIRTKQIFMHEYLPLVGINTL